jgi:hypothetical protein
MKTTTIGRRRGVMFCAAVLIAAGGSMAVSGVAAAQRDASVEEIPKPAKPADAGKGKHGTLTVGVLVIDPDKKSERLPAADAVVRIEGSEEWYRTDDKGRAKLSEIPAGKVTLQIKVIGAAICRLRDVPVAAGDQLLSVLIEKAQEGNCWRE